VSCIGLARTIFVGFIHGIFGRKIRKITRYRVIYGAYTVYTVLANPVMSHAVTGPTHQKE